MSVRVGSYRITCWRQMWSPSPVCRQPSGENSPVTSQYRNLVHLQTVLWTYCIILAVCATGCSSESTGPDSGSQNVQLVADYYSLFLKENRRLPKDEAEFKNFLGPVVAEDAKAKGKTVEELLISPRDGKPLVLFTKENPPPEGAALAVYEQVGKNGSRYLADTAGNIQEVDEVTFRTLVPNAR